MHPHQAQRAQLHFRRLDMRKYLRELIPEHSDMVRNFAPEEARRELEEDFSARNATGTAPVGWLG